MADIFKGGGPLETTISVDGMKEIQKRMELSILYQQVM